LPKLGPHEDRLLARLTDDAEQPKRERRTAQVLFEEVQREGFTGGYDSVRRYMQKWRCQTAAQPTTVYILQAFDPGNAYQFDWSHEWVELGGVPVKVKVAHFRLCHSRLCFCVALTVSPREPGDAARRACPRLRLLRRQLPAGDLR